MSAARSEIGGETLNDLARRIGAAFLIAIAAIGMALAPAAAATPGGEPPPPEQGGFVSPQPGQLSYVVKGYLSIDWNPGEIEAESWRVVRSAGLADINGGCARTTYVKDVTLTVSDSSTVIGKQFAKRCYYFSVWPSGAEKGSDPAYVSGVIRVLKPWTGTYNLYRTGVFSTQRTMTWCVAASVQMMLNIIRGESDQSRENQERYIRYARKNDQYEPAEAQGTDGQGWSRTLAHFGGGDGYRAISANTYKASIRALARRLRETGKPVGLIVMNSGHAWVVTGFDATADPALDHTAEIKAIYVMGPLYPRQTSGGYDMPPNTRLSFERLKNYHTRYYDSSGPNNPWEGTFVTIRP